MNRVLTNMKPYLIVVLGVGFSLPLLAADRPHAKSEAKPKGKAEAGYIRFREHGKGAVMEVAILQMKNAKTGAQVDLVGAVHIGDKAYYERLNTIFKGYDRVLYEMVKPKELDPAKPRDPRKKQSGISRMQNFMGEKLDLEFQLDIVNYGAKNFVHADMTPKQFAKRQKARGENMLTIMFKSFQQEMAAKKKGGGAEQISTVELLRALLSPNFAVEMKYIFAKQFQEMERISAGLDSDEGSVILTERNDVALNVLKKELASGQKKLAIFYGAAHLPDMKEKLIKNFGYKQIATKWIVAWDLPKRVVRNKR
ncbi:MAG: hypothetical protein H8E27_14795 [Verrucomicrobia subdivision 3 bacterium]|nr:hypothetical protein [Limisphaerales bacterium]